MSLKIPTREGQQAEVNVGYVRWVTQKTANPTYDFLDGITPCTLTSVGHPAQRNNR